MKYPLSHIVKKIEECGEIEMEHDNDNLFLYKKDKGNIISMVYKQNEKYGSSNYIGYFNFDSFKNNKLSNKNQKIMNTWDEYDYEYLNDILSLFISDISFA